MSEIPDGDLPIFPFRPNWKPGVTQGLEFLTDVLTSQTGAEQRRALRLSPRRRLTYDVLFDGRERAFFENMLRILGASEFMVPLWWEAGSASTAILAGAMSIQFDQTYREFSDGEYGVVLQDAFTYDVFQVATVGADQILLVDGVSRAYPKNAKVYPLRRARLADMGEMRAHTSRVSTATVEFVVTQKNDFPTEYPFPANPHQYRGWPVMTREPNWREAVGASISRMLDELDNETGLPHWFDTAARAFAAQTYSYQMIGQAAHMEFRDLLLDLRGRQKPIWVPSYTEDFEIAADVGAGAVTLEVLDCGYTYCGGPTAGRQDIQIILRDGTRLFRRITGAALGTPGREVLTVGEAFASAFTVADVRKISFMDVCRLENDKIEIKHLSDTDGAAVSTLVFKSFSDTRVEANTDPAFSIVANPPSSAGADGYIRTEMHWGNDQRIMNHFVQFPDGTKLGQGEVLGPYAGGTILHLSDDVPGENYQIIEINAEQRGAYKIYVEYYNDPETVGGPDWPSVAPWTLDVIAPNGGGDFEGFITHAGQGVYYYVTTVYID